LVMPEGAVAFDLQNIPVFRDYVSENVERWYKFVNGVRRWEAKNGDIRLVYGCDKAMSWGMAALVNTQRKVTQLRFKATRDSSENSTRPLYSWDYFGMAEGKAGPDIEEVNALKSPDDSFDATPPRFSNQCLFIRTLNATLSAKAWKQLHSNIGSTNVLDPNPSSRTTFPNTSHSQRNTFDTSANTQSSPHHTNLGNQRPLTHPGFQGFGVCSAFFEPLPCSFPHHTQLEEGATWHHGDTVPSQHGHLGVPTPPLRFPHPGPDNDAHEIRVAISTTPDAVVSNDKPC